MCAPLKASDLIRLAGALTQTVAKASPTVAVSSSANPNAANQAVFLTALISNGASPTGTVTFYDGATAIGTGTVSYGSATLIYTFPAMGAHSLTATYSGDANNNTATSTAYAQTVSTASTSTALSLSTASAATNQPVTLTATVTGITPTGTVTFMDGAATLGTATLANGTASFSQAFATAGNHSLTAVYSGDAGNSPSTSTIASLGVAQAAAVYYIQPDHLNTPRTITDANNTLVWSWDNTDPFGANVPNENPSNLGQFAFNLRFPGQYHDRGTNLYYNVNRYYDPGLGRYIESDPIGLEGGINTYTYVDGNPLGLIDFWGLKPVLGDPPNPGRGAQSICNGEEFSVSMPNLSAKGWTCPAIEECIREHEMTHINFARKSTPQLCSGNIGQRAIADDDWKEFVEQEKKAFQKELACLKRKQKEKECQSESCKEEIPKMIDLINNRALPALKSGTYGK